MVQVDAKKLRGPSILYKKEDVKKQGQPSIYKSGWKIEDQGSIIDQKGASRLFILPLHSTKLLSPSEKNAAKKNAEIAAHSKLVRESDSNRSRSSSKSINGLQYNTEHRVCNGQNGQLHQACQFLP